MKRKILLGIIIVLVVVIGVLAVVIAQDSSDTLPAEAFADPDGQFIDVDGITLYVLDRGEPTDPAVLLLHGFGGSTFTWRHNIDFLVDAGYRVVAFDRPPYGLADKRTTIDYTTETYIRVTAGLMDALEIDRATLVGHSAGGAVIAAFVLEHPERVDALAFIAGAVRIPGVEIPGVSQSGEGDQQGGGGSPFAALFEVASSIDPQSPLAQFAVRRFVNRGLLEGIVYGNYYDQSLVTQEVLDGYTQVLRVDGWEGAFLRLFTASGGGGAVPGYDFTQLNTVDLPTLILWGEEDAVVPVGVGQALAGYMPQVEVVLYPQVGHLPMEEAPDRFNADLLAFLDQVYGQAR